MQGRQIVDLSRDGQPMSRVRFRIRSIMIAIAVVAVLMAAIRFLPSVRPLLGIMPLSELIPLAVLGPVLFGAFVEFLVFWIYFASQRRRAGRGSRNMVARRGSVGSAPALPREP
jgi:hypothetical protein